MTDTELKALLDERCHAYASSGFIETDPIQIPHLFTDASDIEVSGFLTATLAWGNRTSIIASARKLMHLMDDSPARFARDASPAELKRLSSFVYRTFNGTDAAVLVSALGKILKEHGSLGAFVQQQYREKGDVKEVLAGLRSELVKNGLEGHTCKHVADVVSGSSAKRLNMFFRWMVRPCCYDVDFGLWTDIPTSALFLPLDVHSGTIARQLGLLKRKQNDWKAVEEVTGVLRTFDPVDPVRYDFALFGLGAFARKGEE